MLRESIKKYTVHSIDYKARFPDVEFHSRGMYQFRILISQKLVFESDAYSKKSLDKIRDISCNMLCHLENLNSISQNCRMGNELG